MKHSEIVERARNIAQEPLLKPNREKMALILEEYQRKTPKSAYFFRTAKGVIPHGSEHTLPPTHPYPLFIDHGRGSHIWDVDGNEFIDYILSGGAILLGHNNENLNRSITDLIQNRTNFHGYYDEMEIKAAQKIIEHFPSVEKVRFTSSGAEACLAAIRLARSYTGKKKIIKFRSDYHGWGDAFMTDMEIPGSERLIAHGIPSEVLDLTVLVSQDDLNELEEAFSTHANSGGIAAVIVEPMGGESGLVPFEESFHKKAIEIAHRYGALYIFDEVVTGLRMGLGGAQAALGVMPDVTTLGKALMNGYPSCGAVCGKADIMETLSTGLPGDRPYAYVAGTLAGNLLSVSAAYYNILELERPGVIGRLFRVAEDYVTKLNDMFQVKKRGFFAYNYGGIIRIELTAPHAVPLTSPDAIAEVLTRRGILSHYALAVHNQGVLTRMGRDMISCSHTEEDNDRAAKAYEAMVDILE
ncbi:Glutamate-1-semialdehyde 2,1-aminomutase [subsurface metagenome]